MTGMETQRRCYRGLQIKEREGQSTKAVCWRSRISITKDETIAEEQIYAGIVSWQ